jgi:gluconolactonase
VWFTDPSYGHLQGFRPAPSLPDAVYRLDPRTGRLVVADTGFDKPNGLALSPDGSTLYVADSGTIQGPGPLHPDRPHDVHALAVGHDGIEARRRLAVVEPGFPDGLKVDDAGRVYVSCASGVQVFSPDGTALGDIMLPGAVNFCFGGAERNVLFITADTAIWAAVLNAKGT